MRTIRQVFDLKKTTGDVGIEIEVEGRNLPEVLGRYWRKEEDGSLRGHESAEYVLKNPLTLRQMHNALNYLSDEYEDHGTIVDDTVRAGVHVHVNVQELTLIETFNVIVAYIILEEVLVKFCGTHREGNLFCLRCIDAEYLPLALAQIIKDRSWQHLGTDQLRYASLNVKALPQYGSLEFRAMRSTRDLDLIGQWATILHTLRDVAKKYRDPQDIIYSMSGDGMENFLRSCLGEYAPIFMAFDDYEGMMKRGVRQAQEVAFSIDWNCLREEEAKRAEGYAPNRYFKMPEPGMVKPAPIPFDWGIPKPDDEEVADEWVPRAPKFDPDDEYNKMIKRGEEAARKAAMFVNRGKKKGDIPAGVNGVNKKGPF